MVRSRRTRLSVEPLEAREVPATLVSPTTVTYQDVDGDLVTVLASKPVFTAGNVNTIFQFNAGSVNGSNATKQQLWEIDLSGQAAAAGTGLSVTGVRTAATGGDGRVNVGSINATNVNLGQVVVAGDLGRIRAGNFSDLVPAVAGLTVRSMGRFGLTTQDPNTASLTTTIDGRLDKLIVRSDVEGARFLIASITPVALGSVLIGGSLRAAGGVDGNASIRVQGDVGPVTIRGDVIGDDGEGSGFIQTSTGRLGPVTIGGSLVGAAGKSTGAILAAKGIGQVTIGGSILGSSAEKSGYIYSGTTLAGLTVRGSILGGYGKESGYVESQGNMGPVLITGSMTGNTLNGAGELSGTILCYGKMGGMLGDVPVGFRIGGSLVGGDGNDSGWVAAAGGIGPSRIGGDVLGGNSTGRSGSVSTGGRLESLAVKGSVTAGYGTYTGYIYGKDGIGAVSIGGDLRGAGIGNNSATVDSAGNIGTLTVGGSILSNDNTGSGTVHATGVIGKILVKGSLVGTDTAPVRIVMGAEHPANSNLVLGSLTVLGQVIHADILAGFDDIFAKNADAQIGTVFVGGDWVASNLAAGAVDGGNGFGNSLDAKMSGANVKDAANVKSRIGSLTIGGQMLGTTTAGDHFGIVAEAVGALKVGGLVYAVQAGTGNDNLLLGSTGDLRLNEI